MASRHLRGEAEVIRRRFNQLGALYSDLIAALTHSGVVLLSGTTRKSSDAFGEPERHDGFIDRVGMPMMTSKQPHARRLTTAIRIVGFAAVAGMGTAQRYLSGGFGLRSSLTAAALLPFGSARRSRSPRYVSAATLSGRAAHRR
jgi:hypothetical protein